MSPARQKGGGVRREFISQVQSRIFSSTLNEGGNRGGIGVSWLDHEVRLVGDVVRRQELAKFLPSSVWLGVAQAWKRGHHSLSQERPSCVPVASQLRPPLRPQLRPTMFSILARVRNLKE